TGYQAWDLPIGTESVTISGEFIRAIAAQKQAFGYYFDGDESTFVPLFKNDAAHPSAVPVLSEGDPLGSIEIDTTGKTSIGFGTLTAAGAFFGTEKSTNAGADHAAVYN